MRDVTRGGTQYAVKCSGTGPGGGGGGGGGTGTPAAIEVTGSGSIDDKAEQFQLSVRNGGGGQVRYHDNGANFEMVSDTISGFTQSGSNQVTITGNGHVGSTPVTFTVTVQDNGEPGSNDTFGIVVSGFPPHQGKLSTGNIKVHN
jgi:hypothetical protein